MKKHYLFFFTMLFVPILLLAQKEGEANLVPDVQEYLDMHNVTADSVRLLRNLGHYDKALKVCELHLEKIKSLAGDTSGVYGRGLFTLGTVYEYKGVYDKSMENYTAASKILKKQYGEDSRAYSHISVGTGMLHYRLGKLDEAAKFMQIGRDYYLKKTEEKNTTGYCALIINTGLIQEYRGNLKTSESLYLEAIDIFEKELKDTTHHFYLNALTNLAFIKWETGYLDQTEAMFLKIAEKRKSILGEKSKEYGHVIGYLGGLNMTYGRYEKAETYILKSMEIYRASIGEDHIDFSEKRRNLAQVYLQTGRYKGAEELLLKDLAKQEKSKGQDHKDYGKALIGMADFYSEIGMINKAEKTYVQALNILENALGSDNANLGGFLMDLANFYVSVGKWEESKKMSERGIYLIESKIDQPDPIYGSHLESYAEILFRNGELEKAEPLFIKIDSIFTKVLNEPDNPFYAEAQETFAELKLVQKNYEQAAELLAKVIEIRKTKFGDEYPGLAESYRLMAKTNIYQEIYSEAERFTALANDLLKQNSIRDASHFTEKEMQSYLNNFSVNVDWFSSLNYHTQAPKHIAATYDNTLFYKGFLLDKSLELKDWSKGSPPETQEKYQEWKGVKRALYKAYSMDATDSEGFVALEAKEKRLEKELIENLNGFSARNKQLSWKDVKNGLKGGEAAIEFIHHKYYNPEPTDSLIYAALILKPGMEAPIFVPLFEEKATGSLKATKKLYAYSSSTVSNNLNQLIWKPLSKHLEGTTKIFYTPSGLLHRINIGAIALNETEILADRFDLRRVGSTKLVLKDEKNIHRNNEKTAVVFGGIDFESANSIAMDDSGEHNEDLSSIESYQTVGEAMRSLRDDGWPFLEWSDKEATDVQAELSNFGVAVELYKGKAATEEKFREIAQGDASPRYLHMATHGFFFPDANEQAKTGFQASENPLMRSGLIMAGANKAWKGDDLSNGEDGILTAYEIAQMDLSNTELVVLSACDTGQGDLVNNEGVYGLQRAFKMAGVKYVIMSLWSVSDQKTYEFMMEFYDGLLESNSIPDAYKKAQNMAKQKYALPFNPRNWAGFILVE